MIKKALKSLFIFGLVFLPVFTNAGYWGGGIQVPIGEYVQMSDICGDSDNSNVSHYLTFDRNLNIKYIENGTEYKGARFYACGREGTWTYLYRNGNGLVSGFGARESWAGYDSALSGMGKILNVCVTNPGSTCYGGSNLISMGDFIKLKKNWLSFTIQPYGQNDQPCVGSGGYSCAAGYNHPVAWCFNSEDATYCVSTKDNSGSPLGFSPFNPVPITQLNINAGISQWSSYFQNSPMVGSYGYNNPVTGNTFVEPTDLDRYIEYYETRFGRNKNMCYVGTNDFTTNYGSGNISFEVGTGLTLNELYYKLYGTFGSNNIKNVGSFVNSWLINYSQWFYAGKSYLINYNGPDTNISVNYDNITFPFANKPVAIYFMASNLFDMYSMESTQGEEMVYYCQMKVNYQFYKDNPDLFEEEVESKVSTGINERVQDYYNSQIVNGSGKVGFQVPNMSGTLWGEISSGNVLPEDLNPTNLFKDFFTKVTTLTEGFSPSQNGILPDWIVYPLIFLVLFRIFRH